MKIMALDQYSVELSIYLNFVLYAIYGRLAEADVLMRKMAPAIQCVADWMRGRFPIADKPIYRGMLLDPSTLLSSDPLYTFFSWSESQDVARWFACTRSTISEPLAFLNPALRGYVVSLPAPSARVLFHHSWAKEFGERTFGKLALIHPAMGSEGSRQIEWNLLTQEEVITEPISELQAQSVDVDNAELAVLEHILTPPWMKTPQRKGAAS